MRRRPLASALLFAGMAALTLLGGADAARAQADEELEIQGLVSLSYARSFQQTDLGHDDFDDGNGLDFRIGFQPGDVVAFDLGFRFQTESDYATYYFPLSVRVFAPLPLENVKLYGQGGIGVFFSQLSGKFDSRDNERGSAWQLGAGVEVDLTEDWGATLDATYMKGFGSTDDYEWTTVSLGVLYRWDL